MVKRRGEAAREGKDKPFPGSAVIVGSAVNEAHGQIRRRGHTSSMGPSPLPNHMMDSIEGYLYNISAAATQTIAKVGPLAELAAILAIKIDAVARQQQKIKCLYEQINGMRKIRTQDSGIGTATGRLIANVCPHCNEVGHTASHKNNSCYFDPKIMTNRREWAQKLMDEKGVACKDDK